MTTERTRNPWAFGEVLEGLMRARDMEPDHKNIRRLTARIGNARLTYPRFRKHAAEPST
jgi:hypothetical protein